jgi:hypothetical protein
MSHAMTADGPCAEAGFNPDDLRIPRPPHALPLSLPRREPAWREAMRWSLIALSASLAAGEVALGLFGP